MKQVWQNSDYTSLPKSIIDKKTVEWVRHAQASADSSGLEGILSAIIIADYDNNNNMVKNLM